MEKGKQYLLMNKRNHNITYITYSGETETCFLLRMGLMQKNPKENQYLIITKYDFDIEYKIIEELKEDFFSYLQK